MEKADEQYGFSDEIKTKMQSILDKQLKEKIYDDMSSGQLIDDILEEVMLELHNTKLPYKYIANCMLAQRVGFGLSNINSAYWDKTTDQTEFFYYPKLREKNEANNKEKPLITGLLVITCLSYSSSSQK